jgi:hypothetical protein
VCWQKPNGSGVQTELMSHGPYESPPSAISVTLGRAPLLHPAAIAAVSTMREARR